MLCPHCQFNFQEGRIGSGKGEAFGNNHIFWVLSRLDARMLCPYTFIVSGEGEAFGNNEIFWVLSRLDARMLCPYTFIVSGEGEAFGNNHIFWVLSRLDARMLCPYTFIVSAEGEAFGQPHFLGFIDVRRPNALPLHIYFFMIMDSFESDEFLPPLSRWMTLGGVFLAGTFAAAIALSHTIKYNPTVRAQAQARPAGEVRIVQAATEGRVESILARENQSVEKGEAIAIIDDSLLRNQKNRTQDAIEQCQVDLEDIQGQLQVLEGQILATWQQLGYFPEFAVDGEDESRARERVLETALLDLSRWLPTVAQQLGRERRSLLVKRGELLKDLTRGKRELYQLGVKLDNAAIRSPIDGTILKLNLRNPGQMVEVGGAIAHVVPREVPLIFKARVTAADIGRVKVGQAVQIRVSAYPFPDYGILRGVVEGISPDAIAFENLGNAGGEVYYEVTIAPSQSFLVRGDRVYPLQSGMEARADIISSEETVLTFVLRRARLIADW